MNRIREGSYVNPAIVRSYDIRGRVGQELNELDARALGLAYSAVACGKGMRTVAVCRDGRLSSPALEHALVNALIDGGMRVHVSGLGPTPLLHYVVAAAGLDGGIMVTASHNPADQNGFKLLMAGEPVHGEALRRLVTARAQSRCRGLLRTPADFGLPRIRARYLSYLASIAAGISPLRVVWDCGNGAVGSVILELTQQLPGRHVLLNTPVDGRFPAHHPDPSIAANLEDLRSEVMGARADLGIAFDGDGDRIGVVGSDGEILWPDQVLLLLAVDLLSTQPGAVVVGDVKSSRVLFDGVRERGGRPVMSPSGYVLIRETLLRENAALAGEMSGHILFADCWHRTDDALFAAMRLLLAVSRQRVSIAQFRASLPETRATPELRVSCAEARKSIVMREVAERLRAQGADIDVTDGLRVTTRQGWWLLRQSGTEPKLTARCESPSRSGLETLKQELLSHLRQSGIPVGDVPWDS